MSIDFRPLEASDVEVRVAQCNRKGCSLLLYKDARCDMRLLDDCVGSERWQCRYDLIGNVLYCSVGVEFGGEWVWKQDCGTESNMEKEKGQASDAFKRACFKWGIGRELYTAPFIWVNAGDCTIQKNKQGRDACYDRFSVTEMTVIDGKIASLAIRNDKTGKVVYRMNNLTEDAPAPKKDPDIQSARNKARAAIKAWADKVESRSAQAAWDGLQKRPDYADTAAFYEKVAKEFEDGADEPAGS